MGTDDNGGGSDRSYSYENLLYCLFVSYLLLYFGCDGTPIPREGGFVYSLNR
jgi:hypothetical protein